RLRDMLQLIEREWSVQMPAHHFGCGAAERHLTREHLPESYAQRINIRTNIYFAAAQCSGLANIGVPAKVPGAESAGSDCETDAALARPKSMTLTRTLLSSSRLSMILA